MRICPISVVQSSTNLRHVQKAKNQTETAPTLLAFKGWKAGAGATAGAILGAVVGTALTGGILGPFLIAGVGTIGGGIYGSSKEDNSDDLPDLGDDNNPDWHIHGD